MPLCADFKLQRTSSLSSLYSEIEYTFQPSMYHHLLSFIFGISAEHTQDTYGINFSPAL